MTGVRPRRNPHPCRPPEAVRATHGLPSVPGFTPLPPGFAGGISRAVNVVWVISRFKLAAHTKSRGPHGIGPGGSAPPRLQSPTHHNISGRVRGISHTKSNLTGHETPPPLYCKLVCHTQGPQPSRGQDLEGFFGFHVCSRGQRNSVGGTTAAAPPHIAPEISVAGIIRNRDLQIALGAAVICRGQPKVGFANPVAPYVWQMKVQPWFPLSRECPILGPCSAGTKRVGLRAQFFAHGYGTVCGDAVWQGRRVHVCAWAPGAWAHCLAVEGLPRGRVRRDRGPSRRACGEGPGPGRAPRPRGGARARPVPHGAAAEVWHCPCHRGNGNGDVGRALLNSSAPLRWVGAGAHTSTRTPFKRLGQIFLWVFGQPTIFGALGASHFRPKIFFASKTQHHFGGGGGFKRSPGRGCGGCPRAARPVEFGRPCGTISLHLCRAQSFGSSPRHSGA